MINPKTLTVILPPDYLPVLVSDMTREQAQQAVIIATEEWIRAVRERDIAVETLKILSNRK